MNLSIVVVGLSVTSSWGNGHATTYRALIEALARRGHHVTFLERDVAWYREHRDLTKPSLWTVELYQSLEDIPRLFGELIRNADLVIVGSYVPDGIAISEWVTSHARGITAFYDIDTPVTLAKLDQGLDYLNASMIPRFDLYLSFAGGPVPGMIEERYGSPLARSSIAAPTPTSTYHSGRRQNGRSATSVLTARTGNPLSTNCCCRRRERFRRSNSS